VGRKFSDRRTKTAQALRFPHPQLRISDMAAHRKPTNVLQLSGAFRKDPKRRRIDPPTREPIGNAPKQSPLTFAQAWRYIVKCCPPGVLADRDRPYLEIAASLFVEFRAAPAKFHPAKLSRLTAMLAALGMSPTDASRVSAPLSQPPGDDFD
jgi:hypothetical protein